MATKRLSGFLRGERSPVDASAVLPPSIMPVVILSGSDYQMGYHYEGYVQMPACVL
jgi:hypothetical protein